MSHTVKTIRKWTILTHRWMGVFFCVLFLAWFLSGIVMMYCPFPSVETADRLLRAAPLDPGRIHVSPGQALAAIHESSGPSRLRINVLDGRPVYRFEFGRRPVLVFADDGQRIDAIPREMALRTAAAWTGFPASAASFEGPIVRDDQWTVYSSVRRYGPFWKFSWPNREEIYVSQTTGEVAQDTTRSSRIGAYFGPIPHWLYFRWLASQVPLWTRAVIWLSGAGTVLCILGLSAGVWVYSPSKRYRFPKGATTIPFVGPKRWHVFLGLIFGCFACAWVFSGLLSMGPFSFLSDRDQPDLERALRPDRVDLAGFATKGPRSAIEAASASKVRELEFISFGGEYFYLATESPRKSRIVPLRGNVQNAFGIDQIRDAVKQAVPSASIAEIRMVTKYESYYLDRQNRLPLPVIYVQLNDASRSAYYIDPRTGQVVQSYGTRSRWNRWLYHGLHSMDYPWLYAHRPAWDIIVIMFMLGGVALSLTSLLIAWKVVRRKWITAGFRSEAPRRLPHLR